MTLTPERIAEPDAAVMSEHELLMALFRKPVWPVNVFDISPLIWLWQERRRKRRANILLEMG